MKQVCLLTLSFLLAANPIFAQETTPESGTSSESVPSETQLSSPPEPSGSDKEPQKESVGKESAEKEASEDDIPGQPPKGTSKFVPGIVVASAGTGFGVFMVLLSRINCNDVYKDTDNAKNNPEKNDDDIRTCNKLKPTYRNIGVASIAAGVGIGLPLIYFGIQERKAYKEWKEIQGGGSAAQSQGSLSLVAMDFGRTKTGASFLAPAVKLSLNF